MDIRQAELDGLPALHLELSLPHPIERVWRAVTEPAELERWFVAPVPWTPALFEEFEAGGAAGRILELHAPTTLTWVWSVERYSYQLTPDGEGACGLAFTHAFDPDHGPGWQHAAGWEAYFTRLEAHLAGEHLTEDAAHVGMDERVARFRAAFEGQSPGS